MNLLLPIFFLFVFALTGCVSNPGSCTYTIGCDPADPTCDTGNGGGCVSSDEDVNSTQTCEAFAEKAAERSNKVVIMSTFVPDGDC